MNTWTIKALLDWMTPYLADKGIDAPRLCAEMLLCHVLGKQRIQLYTEFDAVVSPPNLTALRELVKRAAEQEPVAYLVGKAEFYSLEFDVSPACLIPRPETELLVQRAIEFIRTRGDHPRVLDLCTGCGCIAVAIAKNVTGCQVTASDISDKAVSVAEKNVTQYGLADHVTLLLGDLWEAIEGQEPFDLIVSNPPYVSISEYQSLDKNVRDYEPNSALLAGPEGLDIYQRIIPEAGRYLKPSGLLMMEIGYQQGEIVQKLLGQTKQFQDIEVIQDFQKHDRVVKATLVSSESCVSDSNK